MDPEARFLSGLCLGFMLSIAAIRLWRRWRQLPPPPLAAGPRAPSRPAQGGSAIKPKARPVYAWAVHELEAMHPSLRVPLCDGVNIISLHDDYGVLVREITIEFESQEK